MERQRKQQTRIPRSFGSGQNRFGDKEFVICYLKKGIKTRSYNFGLTCEQPTDRRNGNITRPNHISTSGSPPEFPVPSLKNIFPLLAACKFPLNLSRGASYILLIRVVQRISPQPKSSLGGSYIFLIQVVQRILPQPMGSLGGPYIFVLQVVPNIFIHLQAPPGVYNRLSPPILPEYLLRNFKAPR